MSRALTKFVNDEYGLFRRELIDSWSVSRSKIAPLDPILKRIHKKYLSLACAATIVGRRTRGKDYLHALIEVAYLSQALALKGLENPVFVLLRQSTELALKYIYFSFHPVEHYWTLTREDYKDLNFQILLEFVRRTDEHRDFAEHLNICDELNESFSLLSRYIHVHNKRFMNYSGINSTFPPNIEVLRRLDRSAKRLWRSLVILLILFHPGKYHHAQAIERDLMLSSIEPKLRRRLHYYCSQHSKSRYSQ